MCQRTAVTGGGLSPLPSSFCTELLGHPYTMAEAREEAMNMSCQGQISAAVYPRFCTWLVATKFSPLALSRKLIYIS